MAYLNTHTRTTGPTSNDSFQPIGRTPTLYGVFMGYVKDVEDVQRMGRLRVWIPEFGSAPDEENSWVIVNYCSPFAGATNVQTNNPNDVQSFDGTQTSYGMWMAPPDINNQVLVMFINGDPAKGIWIGCLYNQFMNNMVPGVPVDSKNYQYPGKQIPVAEYNKWDTKVTEPDRAFHPYEETKFRGVSNQGLINDSVRGTTTSGARREAPSQVYGILTPGPAINPDTDAEFIKRKGGSSFVMDDGVGTEYISFATKSGAKIRFDETNGFVYVINRDGTGWIQIDQVGNIDIFGARDISLRAQRDFNVRADRNINIEAGQNIFMKAAKDTIESTTTFTYDVNNLPRYKEIPVWKFVGEGKGAGGNIVTQALNDTHTTVKNNSYLTVGKNLEIKVATTIDMSAGTSYNLTSPTITNKGAVKIIGTLDVTDAVKFGSTLNVKDDVHGKAGSFSSTVSASDISSAGPVKGSAGLFNSIPNVMPGPGASSGSAGPAGTAGPTVTIPDPPAVTPAEVKPTVDKINILATWSNTQSYPLWKANTQYFIADVRVYNSKLWYCIRQQPPLPSFDQKYWVPYEPEDKFKRKSEGIQTTTTRFPTYEPCPEHEQFTFGSISGYVPQLNEGDKTYNGSGGAGNEAKASPPTNTTPGANNTELPPTETTDSVVTKDLNMKALECQLKIHEGVKYKVYLDTLGLPTAGIGHLLRANEQMPVGTAVSEDQVSRWFQQDSSTCIKDAQNFVGMDVWGDLDDNRKRALADLAYNMGGPRLNKFTTFRAAMQRKDFSAAGEALKNSKWYTQVGRRGPAIVSQIVNGVDPNGCDKKFPP